MSIQMVNGYSCANCAEASLAKRGIDPHESDASGGKTFATSATSGVEAAGNVAGYSPASDALVAHAVEAASGGADVRAKLDYSHTVDRLI